VSVDHVDHHFQIFPLKIAIVIRVNTMKEDKASDFLCPRLALLLVDTYGKTKHFYGA
jgi:hypothetical protein